MADRQVQPDLGAVYRSTGFGNLFSETQKLISRLVFYAL